MQKVEGFMFEEHELVRASATECMCNLVLSTEVRRIILKIHYWHKFIEM